MMDWLLRIAGHSAKAAQREAHASLRREQEAWSAELSADERRMADLMERRGREAHVVLGAAVRAGGQYRVGLGDLGGMFAWVSAGTGSGKSRLAGGLVEQLVRAAGAGKLAVVVLDMKGELADLTLRSLAETLSSDGATAEPRRRPITIRPFAGSYLPELQLLLPERSIPPLTQAHAVAETLEATVTDLGIRQSGALTMLVALAVEAGLSLLDLRWLLYDQARVRALAETSALPEARLFVRTRLAREAAATIDGVGARLDAILRVGALKAALAGPGMVDFRRSFEPGAVTILDLGGAPLGAEGAKRAFAAILLTRLTWAAFDASRQVRCPTIIVADEIQEALTPSTIHHVERIVTTGRSYGLGLWSVHQSVAQLPRELQTILNTNVRLRVIGRSGADDAKASLEWLPVTGRRQCPRGPEKGSHSGPQFLSPSEEQRLRMQELGRLPLRHFLVADRLAPFPAPIIEARAYDPPAWETIPGAAREAILRGAVGRPREDLLAHANEIERSAAASLDRAPQPTRRGRLGADLTPAALPDAFVRRRRAAEDGDVP